MGFENLKKTARMYDKMKECKRHKWRVGSKCDCLVGKKIIPTKLNIWCERCNKRIKASIYCDWELDLIEKRTNKMEYNLNKWQRFAFWYCVVMTLGLYFALLYLFDDITPKELIKYVYGVN